LLYQAMGNYVAAEPLYREALAIRRETLGEVHPYYATSLNNLAELYHVMSTTMPRPSRSFARRWTSAAAPWGRSTATPP
jgi:hypothetical protein